MNLQERNSNRGEEMSMEPNLSRGEANKQFYDEYRKIVGVGFDISQQLRQLLESKQQLWKKLLEYEKKAEEEFKDKMRRELPERKKRNRRAAHQIQKAYECQAQGCFKSYGSEGSLHQHLKLKHPALAQSISKHSSDHQMDSSF